MSRNIRKCPSDGHYTIAYTCPVCGSGTRVAHPARYSPEDVYGKYRREMKND